MLTEFGVQLTIDDFNLKKLAAGAAPIFICNHVYPGLDEVLLHALLQKVDQEIACIQPNARLFPHAIQRFLVAPDKVKPRLSTKGFLQKIDHELEQGKRVGVVLPFARSGFLHFGNPDFLKNAVELLMKLNKDIVPIHFVPEKPLHWAQISKKAKWLMHKPSEPITIKACVGNLIQAADLAAFQKKKEIRQFLQAHIFCLGTQIAVKRDWFLPSLEEKPIVPLAQPIGADVLEAEVGRLREQFLVLTKSKYEAFIAPTAMIPFVMLEIGRLRELTFRAVGEGTGQERDLDQYDIYYEQLFIWDTEERCIVGGYRLGSGPKIMFRYGFSGFYSNSLFKFKRPFHRVLSHSLELGRSFIVAEYQKKPLPLLIQWQTILQYIQKNDNIEYISGPVSITNEYAPLSKALMVDFLQRFYTDESNTVFVEPRKPYKIEKSDLQIQLLSLTTHGSVQKLGSHIESIEPLHQGIPILLRQYIKQNARFLAFNRDPKFSNCIDGFMLLELQNLPAHTIEMLSRPSAATASTGSSGMMGGGEAAIR
jgi:Acetyltransferase (GNAT) domain